MNKILVLALLMVVLVATAAFQVYQGLTLSNKVTNLNQGSASSVPKTAGSTASPAVTQNLPNMVGGC